MFKEYCRTAKGKGVILRHLIIKFLENIHY